MNIKKLLAGVVLVGLATVGSAGTAFAASSTPGGSSSPVTAAHRRECVRAAHRLADLQRDQRAVEARIDKLQRLERWARAHHRDELAKKVAAEIDKLQHERERLVDAERRVGAWVFRHCVTP